MPQRPPQPVELPDNEGIAGAQLGQRAIKLRPRSQRPALLVVEDPLAAGGLEGVELQAGGLDVGRDARVTDEPGRRRIDKLRGE
jgi:hypothetical protein